MFTVRLFVYAPDTTFEMALPDSVLASVRAKSVDLQLSGLTAAAGRRVVSDVEWGKMQQEVGMF